MERSIASVFLALASLGWPVVAGAGGNSGGTMTALELPDDAVPGSFDMNAWAINDAGTIVGTYESTAGTRPIRWVGRQVEVLDGDVVTVLADGTEVSGSIGGGDGRNINEKGQIAATVTSLGAQNEGNWAALWDDEDGVWRTIPRVAGARRATARGIDAYGNVAGNSPLGAWLWRGGAAELLPTPRHLDICAVYSMNSLGAMTGECYDRDEIGHAVVWWQGRVIELADVGLEENWGRAINDLGLVVGFGGEYRSEDILVGPAVWWSVWRPHKAVVLADPGAINGVNNRCELVGFTGINGGEGAEAPQGVLWRLCGLVAIDLGTLGGGWSFPRDVNNKGVVVGIATDGDEIIQPFVWDP